MNKIKDIKLINEILNFDEDTANTIMFIMGMLVPVIAFIVVVGFLNGTLQDWTALLIAIICILFRILEKKTKWFKKYAKYAYVTIPFWCNCVLIIDNEGRFAAATQVYIMYLMASIIYYNVKVTLWCALLTISSTVASIILFPDAMLKMDEISIWFFILVIYIMAIIFAVIISKRIRHMVKEIKNARHYEDELIYLEQLQKKDEKYSEFIHNINHYFFAIGELARQENCNQIVGMIEEMSGKILHTERIIYTNHKTLNAILAEKASEAELENIDLNVYVEPVIKLGNVTDGDLVSMIGNLLDNAIEAARQCEPKKRNISVWIYMEKNSGICVIKTVNYFYNPPIFHNSRLVSGKKEGEMHGIGIKSVENTAQKYGGYLEYFINDDKFTSILILQDDEV